MKILHLSIIGGIGIVVPGTILIMFAMNPTSHAEITIEGLHNKYNVGEKLDFSVIAKGYGNSCNGPSVEVYNETNQSQLIWGGSYMQYTGMYCDPHDFEYVFHVGVPTQYSASDKVPIILDKPGTYLVKAHLHTNLIESDSEQEFSVIPLEENSSDVKIAVTKTTSDIMASGMSKLEKIPVIINGANSDYSFNYTITGGEIEQAKADIINKKLILSMKTTGNGTLIADLPRELIDSKINGQDSAFIVLEDGTEVRYNQTTTSQSRILSIPFQYDVSQIEITAPVPIQ